MQDSYLLPVLGFSAAIIFVFWYTLKKTTNNLTNNLYQENAIFGVAPEKLKIITDPSNGYDVPEILVLLRQRLIENGGIKTEGIFRLQGNDADMFRIKASINIGDIQSIQTSDDPHVFATLIKRWFREIPDPILSQVPPELLQKVENEDDVNKVLNSLPELQRNLYLWLLDLLIAIMKNLETSKMTLSNLAIVFAPNMISAKLNHMEEMNQLAKANLFIQKSFHVYSAAKK